MSCQSNSMSEVVSPIIDLVIQLFRALRARACACACVRACVRSGSALRHYGRRRAELCSFVFLLPAYAWHPLGQGIGIFLSATMVEWPYSLAVYQGMFWACVVIVTFLVIYIVLSVSRPRHGSLAWWYIWACTTVLYAPVSRVLLRAFDCDYAGRLAWAWCVVRAHTGGRLGRA